jgi:23S rRNA (cytosine1962-C5)-methyltransferase
MKNITKSKIDRLRKDLQTDGWADYELLDSGSKKKLERFSSHQLVRFEKDAIWKQSLPENVWGSADAEFTLSKGERIGSWKFLNKKPRSWSARIDGLEVRLNVSESRHIGIFPEQLENWRWIEQKITASRKKANILNLFGYTGVATLYAARAGASVTHIDASRKAIEIGKKSLQASELGEKPVRWLVDDAAKFIAREIRRGNKYDGIIMDPPKFGRGPKGEIWKFKKSVLNLFSLFGEILSDDPFLFIMTAYDIDQSAEDLAAWLEDLLKRYGGKIEFGDLIQHEKSSGRKIHQAVYARWSP